MLVEIVVMYPIQHRRYREGIDNLLVLLIGGIPIAMPTVLSVTMAIGSHRLSEQGAITKRMTAIEEMAGMDVLCSDKTGTLTLNKLTVDKDLIEVRSPTCRSSKAPTRVCPERKDFTRRAGFPEGRRQGLSDAAGCEGVPGREPGRDRRFDCRNAE